MLPIPIGPSQNIKRQRLQTRVQAVPIQSTPPDRFLRFRASTPLTFPVPISQNADPSHGSVRDNGYVIAGSELLKPYTGPMKKEAGFSTVPGCIGILKARPWDVPLSTCGAGNCAIAIFYNDATKQHGLIHQFSFHDEINEPYREDIQRFMPQGFNRVVFIPGRSHLTQQSVNSFLKTITSYYPNVALEFRHFPGNGLEVASYQGHASYIPGKPGGFQSTFTERDDSY